MDNLITNNVIAFPKWCQTVGCDAAALRSSQHPASAADAGVNSSFTFTHNIVLLGNASTTFHHTTQVLGLNNMTFANNTYWNAGQQNTSALRFGPNQTPLTFAAWQTRGKDNGSIVADPMFLNASGLDFSHLHPASPALALGFTPIDTSNVGPRPLPASPTPSLAASPTATSTSTANGTASVRPSASPSVPSTHSPSVSAAAFSPSAVAATVSQPPAATSAASSKTAAASPSPLSTVSASASATVVASASPTANSSPANCSRSRTCAGHGTCTARNDVAPCVCDVGYTDAGCSRCSVGFIPGGTAGYCTVAASDQAADVAVAATLRLAVNLNVTGATGSATRAAFAANLLTDLTACLRVDATRVNVTALQASDVYVDVMVALLPPSTAGGSPVILSAPTLATRLAGLVADRASALYAADRAVSRLIDVNAAPLSFVAYVPAPAALAHSVQLSAALALSWSVRDGTLTARLSYAGSNGPAWFVFGLTAQPGSMVASDVVVFEPGRAAAGSDTDGVNQYVITGQSAAGLVAVPLASQQLYAVSVTRGADSAVTVQLSRSRAAGSYVGAQAIPASGSVAVVFAVGPAGQGLLAGPPSIADAGSGMLDLSRGAFSPTGSTADNFSLNVRCRGTWRDHVLCVGRAGAGWRAGSAVCEALEGSQHRQLVHVACDTPHAAGHGDLSVTMWPCIGCSASGADSRTALLRGSSRAGVDRGAAGPPATLLRRGLEAVARAGGWHYSVVETPRNRVVRRPSSHRLCDPLSCGCGCVSWPPSRRGPFGAARRLRRPAGCGRRQRAVEKAVTTTAEAQRSAKDGCRPRVENGSSPVTFLHPCPRVEGCRSWPGCLW